MASKSNSLKQGEVALISVDVELFVTSSYHAAFFPNNYLVRESINRDLVLAVLPVGGSTGKYVANKEITSRIANHMSNRGNLVEVFLLFCSPGVGKTRRLRELLVSSFNTSDITFSSTEVEINKWVVIPVSFRSDSRIFQISTEDFELFTMANDSIVWIRLFYVYCAHEFETFAQLRSAVLRAAKSKEVDPAALTLPEMITRIRRGCCGSSSSTYKEHALLVVDDVHVLLDVLNACLPNKGIAKRQFDTFIEGLCSLQDDRDVVVGDELVKQRVCSVILSAMSPNPFRTSVARTSKPGKEPRPFVCCPIFCFTFDQSLDFLGGALSKTGLKGSAAASPPHDPTPRIMSDLKRPAAGPSNKPLGDPEESDIVSLLLTIYGQAIPAEANVALREKVGRSEAKEQSIVAYGFDTFDFSVNIPIFMLLGWTKGSFAAVGVPLVQDLLDLVKSRDMDNTVNMSKLLMLREIMLRGVRPRVNNLLAAPINFASMTFVEIYGGSDVSVAPWAASALMMERFDFTAPFQSNVPETRRTFPTYDERVQFVNRAVFLSRPEYQWGYVARALSGEVYAVVEQHLFHVEDDARLELQDVNNAWKRAVRELSKVGWPAEKVLLVIKSDRAARDYSAQLSDCNVILLARERLEKNLGVTGWHMFGGCGGRNRP